MKVAIRKGRGLFYSATMPTLTRYLRKPVSLTPRREQAAWLVPEVEADSDILRACGLMEGMDLDSFSVTMAGDGSACTASTDDR